jgi:hypothetical protein
MKRKGVGRRIIFLALIIAGMSGCEKYINDITNEQENIGSVLDKVEAVQPAQTASDVLAAEEKEIELKNTDIAFSKTKHFYSEDIEIEILSNKPGQIYYTVDGTEPADKKKLYEVPITLTAGEKVKATSIKAKAYFDDGSESDVITHTYFVGKNIAERFDTLIISVNTDPYNLYDYEYGIFVEGKLRDDYIRENPGARIDPDEPANFNMRGKEAEREVYLEIFEPNGIRVISQKAGIRTYGGWSRAREQKSFKIFARKEYDKVNNKLRYEFFHFKTSADGEGDILDTFKRLVVRNCGNDHGFGFIRDELFQTLAGIAGYKDYEAVRPVAVFINGEYRGFYWLHENYNDEYFEDHYGKYDGIFEIVEWGEYYEEPDVLGGNEDALAEFEDLYFTYASMDLTDESNYQSLCKVMDVENYLEYFAMNIYIGNEDWPHNNYRLYRYYPADGEGFGEAPFDGKWRFLLHDMDFSFGIYGTGPTTDFLGKLMRENGASPLFSQLMKREDCREVFVRKTLDLANGALSPVILNSVLDKMNESRLNEIKHMFGTKLVDGWMNEMELNKRLSAIKTYGKARQTYILDHYNNVFKYGSIYELEVTPAEGCKVKINSYTVDSTFSGSYYSDLDTIITAVLPEGKALDYWMVNEQRVDGDKLIINSSLIKKNKAKVSFVTK